MKKKNFLRAGRLWLEGVVLFLLRLAQLRTGFDPATGLALPSLAGRCLWIALLLCFGADAVLCAFRPGDGKRSFPCCFRPPEGPLLGGLTAGGFLLMAGSALLLFQSLPPQGAAALSTAAGVLGIAGGAGLLLLVKELRGGGTPSVLPLTPVMFFSVLFLLTVYFPEESNPVLDRFYPLVLGAAIAAYFLYQFSGFFKEEGNLRWFGLTGSLTVIACLTAAADCLGDLGRLLVYLGFALTATVVLLLEREEPLPEPESPDEEDAAEEEETE